MWDGLSQLSPFVIVVDMYFLPNFDAGQINAPVLNRLEPSGRYMYCTVYCGAKEVTTL